MAIFQECLKGCLCVSLTIFHRRRYKGATGLDDDEDDDEDNDNIDDIIYITESSKNLNISHYCRQLWQP